MIMPSDKEYKTTKQIMLGKATINSDFIELAKWIDETYDVKTINIIYDRFIAARKKQSRLQICFEFERESLKFRDGQLGNFHSDKQNAIAKMFREILRNNKSSKKITLTDIFKPSSYITDNILIVFSAFEPVARIEANENVPQDKVTELKKGLNCNDLWEISRAFDGTTFLVYTDKQVEHYENSEIRKIWADKYFDILETYNEFGYFKRDKFNIYLDSKESFDNNYESNWYYYYK